MIRGRMKIILANPRGFCAGVNMAIDCVDQVLKLKGPPVYVYHEIVHNKHVVQDFQGRGVTFVDSIDEVPEGATVVYSAHGISPDVRKASRGRNLVEVDGDLPARDQGPHGGPAVRPRGVQDRLHRPPRPRRGDRHRRRGPGLDHRRREPRRGRPPPVRGRRQARLRHPDDAQHQRRHADHLGPEEAVPAHQGPAQGRHLLRDDQPPDGRQRPLPGGRLGPGRRQPETAATASGWSRRPSWPAGLPT